MAVPAMAAKRTPTALTSLPEQLDAAHARVTELEAGEAAAVQTSDEAFAAWLRQKRLADGEVARLVGAVAAAEREVEAEKAKARRAEYNGEYKSAALLNKEVEDMLRVAVPRAWGVIEQYIEKAALAEIRTAAVIRAMPADYEPEEWIGDPDRTVRCGPPQNYEVISDRVVRLWVDPVNGDVFSNQDQGPRTRSAVKKAFHETTYRPMRPVNEPLKFYQALRMPRLDAVGDQFLYDGSSVRSPYDALAGVQRARNRPAASERPILTKLEPVERPDVTSSPPPLTDS